MGTGIKVGSKNWSKLGNDTGINIDSKMETESQGWGSGSHSHSYSISLNGKLANCPRFVIGYVQICMMKLSLDQSLQAPRFFVPINMARVIGNC